MNVELVSITKPNINNIKNPEDLISYCARADIEVPNDSADMSSWESSACYPRRTFYPLSDGPSTRDHRITMTDFRLCSTRQSRSQAGLCHCTLTDGFQPS